MLDTTETTLGEAIDDLDGTIEERAADMAGLDPEGDTFASKARSANDYQQMLYGLEWAADEFDADAEVVIGAPTAGEQALMHEKSQDNAGQERMRLWFAAAATETAPWGDKDIKVRFQELANCHGGLIDWIEWTANKLGRPEGSEGNRLRRYYAERRAEANSESATTSDT